MHVLLGTASKLPPSVGNKAALLHQASRVGLRVPAGIILLHEAWQSAQRAGLITVNANRITCPNPAALISALNMPPLLPQVAVRSAFSAEDRADQSMAGFFHSQLHVNSTDPAELASALCAVWESANAQPGDFRRDVLIMAMVDAKQAGVAFSESDYADDLVNYTDGTADTLVGGQVAGQSLWLPRRETPPQAAPFSHRLQKLLNQSRHHFGDKEWDIEWADDGRNCWLVQIRPITRPPRRNEAFTYANIREIMPDPPSYFMADVVAGSAHSAYAYYRSFDPTLPQKRPMIENFAQRPLFNLSLLVDTMRHWGLPTRLVTNSIGGQSDVEFGLQLGRFLSKTPVLLKQGWAQINAVRYARKATLEILTRTKIKQTSLADYAQTVQWMFTRLVTEMLNLTAALSAPLLILRLTQTLSEHNARQQSISTKMYTDQRPLQEIVKRKPHLAEQLRQGSLPQDPEFQAAWQTYIDKHGSRGIYESDMARPRYHEAPQSLLVGLSFPSQHTKQLPARTLRGILTWPVWWQCRRVLDAREWWRYNSMTGYDQLRQLVLAHAQPLVDNGTLPTIDHLWMLNMAEWAQLDSGWRPDTDFWAQRQTEIEDAHNYNFPDLIHRFDDLETFRPGFDPAAPRDQLSGVSLTEGNVSGRAWVLAEPSVTLPDGYKPESTILVARSVDAGWIPTFSLVAGVAVEIGGDLSHGSIILREIGIPATTNVAELTQHIKEGDHVQLIASQGVIKRL